MIGFLTAHDVFYAESGRTRLIGWPVRSGRFDFDRRTLDDGRLFDGVT